MSKAKRELVRRTPEEAGDLVGVAEAAEILGVERTRIARYRKTGVLPAPLSTLRATAVWLRVDIEKMARERADKKAARAAA